MDECKTFSSLQILAGQDFVNGLVLYDGEQALSFGDGLWAVGGAACGVVMGSDGLTTATCFSELNQLHDQFLPASVGVFFECGKRR